MQPSVLPMGYFSSINKMCERRRNIRRRSQYQKQAKRDEKLVIFAVLIQQKQEDEQHKISGIDLAEFQLIQYAGE